MGRQRAARTRCLGQRLRRNQQISVRRLVGALPGLYRFEGVKKCNFQIVCGARRGIVGLDQTHGRRPNGIGVRKPQESSRTSAVCARGREPPRARARRKANYNALSVH